MPQPARPVAKDAIAGVRAAGSAEESGGVAPAIKEVAIFFARGQNAEAIRRLVRGIRENEPGAAALQGWLMLFDLYQYEKMKAEFETLALKFVVKFERSPPLWVEAEHAEDRSLMTGGIAYCGVSGAIEGTHSAQLEQLRVSGGQQRALRIDFSKLQSIDAPGCARLLAVMAELRAAGKELVLTGEAQLLSLLEGACAAGGRDTDAAVWALRFEIFRMLGLKDRFEETAINFAVTYEVSPPSWEVQPGVKSGPRLSSAILIETDDTVLRLSQADLGGPGGALAAKIRGGAAVESPLVVDFSGVARVDPASATALLKAFTEFHQRGAAIVIRGANELIAALFAVIGITRFVTIERRK